MAGIFDNKYMDKNKRDPHLAIAPNPVTKQTIRSGAVDKAGDYEGGAHMVGRLSYAMKCKQQGCFVQTCVDIRNYRTAHPNSTFLNLWRDVLHKNYPYIFEKDVTEVYSGNVQRIIDGEDEWRKAYYSPAGDLVGMAKYRIERILEKDDVDDTTVIKAYDTLMKYDIAKDDTKIAFSEETNETLNNIAQGLKDLATGV